MVDVVESVKAGGQIATPLQGVRRSSRRWSSQMITVGEETGGLDTMLNKVADFYEDEVAAAVKAMTSILEPIMIVFVGRHRRLRRHRHVHADVQGLRLHQVAVAAAAAVDCTT